MFIEISEYTEYGDVIGTCLVNTDDIYYIDNYDEDCKIWELHIGQHENDTLNVKMYIDKKGYSIIKNSLKNNNVNTL